MALPEHTLSLIAALPKAELHLHVEGSFEPEQVMEFVARNGVDFPHADVAALKATYEFANLAGFGAVYQLNSKALVTERDFYDLTMAYLRRVRADNVLHVEIAMSPQPIMARGASAPMMIEAVLAALDDGKQQLGMTGGLIIGCQRNRGPEDGMRMLEVVRPYRDDVLALGLASMEVGFPPAPFEAMFDRARDMGWKTVAHAGEEGPPEYIWEAIDILKVDRIDHGVRCEEDPRLMAALAERQIPLTVCPLSNVYLKVFPTIGDHNIARLLRAGLLVTVNSDDPPYFGGYVNENYAQCADALTLSEAELIQLARNSFIGSFAPDALKTAYLADIEATIATGTQAALAL
ncbi:MAG: adenosine deaminase [Cypionkella sp.]